MPSPNVVIRYTRAFEGPIHERLYACWDAAAEFLAPWVGVRVFHNAGARLSHAQSFQAMWQEEAEFDNAIVVFTEADFLPNLEDEDWYRASMAKKATAWGVQYASRGVIGQLFRYPNLAGGWFVGINKEKAPKRLSFAGDPDPCCQLPLQIRHHGGRFFYFAGSERAIFLDYAYGTHLFWSRHYNDPPQTPLNCGKLTAGDVQNMVNKEISRWIATQPRAYKTIFAERFGRDELSYCEDVAAHV
jgi:hypothetical protein